MSREATEALILENELIKRYQPRYNVMLKDSKTNPYLKITNEAFSKVQWYLRVTLEELDVDRPLIMIINGFVEGGRGQVVTA